MTPLFSKPYPARAAIEIKALPKGAKVEIEAVMTLEESKKK
jgi:2-iminobutanoate/2-iminopropanoate deaminase